MTEPKRPTGARFKAGGALPRDEAFSVEFKGGTGTITRMCACGDFLEIYKADATFRFQTPEAIDPERTNPDAPFTSTQVAETGSANPIIARVLLQSIDILGAATFTIAVDKDAIQNVLFEIKESLLHCERFAQRVVAQVDEATQRLATHGAPRAKGGRFISPLPQVVSLDAEATSFLVNARRAIKNICELVPLFGLASQRDNNFEHLHEHLSETIGAEAPLTEVVAYYAPGTKYLINLRNYQEHPNPEKRTHVDNFRVLPDGSIIEPMWYVTGRPPASIRGEMLATVDFLVEVAEWLFMNAVMTTVDKRFPYVVSETPDNELDPELPIKYRLTFDPAKLPPRPPREGEAKSSGLP